MWKHNVERGSHWSWGLQPWMRKSLALFSFAVALSFLSPAHAVKIPVNEDTFINLNLLMQPWYLGNFSKTHSPQFISDFYLRRTRLILGGQVSKWVSFFMETDMPNWGKGGDWTNGSFFVQDAFVSFNIHEAFNISGGMLLAPFSRNFYTSAAKLHSIDYHGTLAKYPTDSQSVWRDSGVMIHGLLANKKLEYRLIVAQGLGGTPNDYPRIIGRISFNVFDPEIGLFPAGNYLGKSKILAIGLGADIQPQGAKYISQRKDPTDPASDDVYDYGHYFGLAGDVYWDFPLGGNMSLTGVAAFLYYGGDHYVEYKQKGDDLIESYKAGVGAYFDTGFSIGKWEPIISLEWFRPKGASGLTGQMLNIMPGVNYWLHGYNANIKFELKIAKAAGRELKFNNKGMEIQPTIQTQVLF